MSKVVITRSKLDGLATTISAKSGEPLPLTIAQMDAAVQGIETNSTLVVTLSYNESTDMWEPDKTFAEAVSAYSGNKDVTTSASYPAVSSSISYDELSGNITYTVFETYTNISDWSYGYKETSYIWTSSGITVDMQATSYVPSDATATPPDVTQGKVFYNASGRQVGTATTPIPTLQSKTATPTTSQQTITPDSGYDGLSSVTVNAMPTGTAGTPTAAKGSVSNHSVTVTPSVTNTTGYIAGGTHSGTAVTVSASELVSGSETKTENGTYDVTNLASLVVNVAGGGSAYRRIEVCPQQTATPNSSRQATLSNVTGSLSDGLHYVVTYDGSEYYTTCELLWSTDSVIGEPAILFNTVSDVTYPFAIDWTSSSTLALVANDTQQHTVKVERLELIEEPVEFVVYHTSSSEPTSSQGSDGDIWLVTA